MWTVNALEVDRFFPKQLSAVGVLAVLDYGRGAADEIRPPSPPVYFTVLAGLSFAGLARNVNFFWRVPPQRVIYGTCELGPGDGCGRSSDNGTGAQQPLPDPPPEHPKQIRGDKRTRTGERKSNRGKQQGNDTLTRRYPAAQGRQISQHQ